MRSLLTSVISVIFDSVHRNPHSILSLLAHPSSQLEIRILPRVLSHLPSILMAGYCSCVHGICHE